MQSATGSLSRWRFLAPLKGRADLQLLSEINLRDLSRLPGHPKYGFSDLGHNEPQRTRSGRVGGFKVQVQQCITLSGQRMAKGAMEKMENKGRLPLSHGTTTAISLNLFTQFVALGL